MNDLPSVVQSQVRLFADDCLLYRPITDSRDHYVLDQDLAALSQWADTWRMKCNPQTCFIMIRTHLNVFIVCVDASEHKSMILNIWESKCQVTLDGSDVLQQQTRLTVSSGSYGTTSVDVLDNYGN